MDILLALRVLKSVQNDSIKPLTSQIHYCEITRWALYIFMGFLGFATMSTSYYGLVRSIQCSVWACLWMSGTFFTILIEISHYAYFIVLKNCRVLVVIWPTWPVTWDRGYESHWIHKKIEHFFSSTFFSFLVYIYHVHNKYRVFNKKMWKRDHFLHFLTVVQV